MIGQIGPLVQSGRKRHLLVLHVAGGLAGGATVGATLGLVGLILSRLSPGSLSIVRDVGLPAFLLYVGLIDLGLRAIPRIVVTRQTPGWWPCALGHAPASLAWGCDLGFAVTTRLSYQATLALPLFALVSTSFAASVVAMGLYGLMRATAVAGVIVSSKGEIGDACTAISLNQKHMQRMVGFSAVAIGALLLTGIALAA